MSRLVPVVLMALASQAVAAPVPKVKKDQWLVVKSDGVYLLTDGTEKLVKLTKGEGIFTQGSWSPDGQRIAFTCNAPDETGQIFTMDADGGNLKQLTTDNGSYIRPNWSPDGKTLLFTSLGRKGGTQIAVMDADTGKIVKVVRYEGDHPYQAEFSPDGKSIAFLRGQVAYVMDADGKNEKEVGRRVYPYCINWSPDGKQLIHSHHNGGEVDSQLYVVGRDGEGKKQLTAFEKKLPMNPSWSSDGRRIAFTVEDDTARPRQYSVWVMDADGKNQKQLLDPTSDAATYDVQWRPK